MATSGYTENALSGKVTLPERVRFLTTPASCKTLAAAAAIGA